MEAIFFVPGGISRHERRQLRDLRLGCSTWSRMRKVLHNGLAQPQAACAIPALEPSRIVGSQFFAAQGTSLLSLHGPKDRKSVV